MGPDIRMRSPLDPIYASDVQPFSDGAFVEVRDGVVGGVRTFSWLVTPWEPGQFPVGPILYSFVDLYVGDFGTVATPEIWMDVLTYAPPR